MTRIILIVMVAAVAACGSDFGATVEQRPAVRSLSAPCPDPADRVRLNDASTYRDLAASREEAIVGWELCHAAAG